MISGTYYVVDRDDLWDLLCVDRDVSGTYYVVDRDDLWDLLCGGQG